MRFCEECGAKIEDDTMLFCDECSAKLEPVEQPAENNTDTVPENIPAAEPTVIPDQILVDSTPDANISEAPVSDNTTTEIENTLEAAPPVMPTHASRARAPKNETLQQTVQPEVPQQDVKQAVPDVKPVQQVTPQPAAPQQPVEKPSMSESAPKRKINKLIPIIAAACVAVAAIVVGIVLITGNKDKNASQPQGSVAKNDKDTPNSSDDSDKQNDQKDLTSAPDPVTNSPAATTEPTPQPTATPQSTPKPTATPSPVPTAALANTLSTLLSDTNINDDLFYEYIIWDSNIREITNEDLYGLNGFECKLARNEIFARHGRKCASEDLQNYFDSKSWYYGYYEPNEFDESWLSTIERYNVNFIKDFEDKKLYETYQYYDRFAPEKAVRFYKSYDSENYLEEIDIELIFKNSTSGQAWIQTGEGNPGVGLNRTWCDFEFEISKDMSIVFYYQDANNPRFTYRTGDIITEEINGTDSYYLILDDWNMNDFLNSWELTYIQEYNSQISPSIYDSIDNGIGLISNEDYYDNLNEEPEFYRNDDISLFFLYSDHAEYIGIPDNTEYPSEIIIPDQVKGLPVTAIGYCALSGKDKIKELTIPESCIFIDETAFDYMSSDVIFNVFSGSYAESFCKSHHLKYCVL